MKYLGSSHVLISLLVSLLLIPSANASSTTTFKAETTNNTSTANSFMGCEYVNGRCVNNGNLRPSNVSGVDVHTLLNAGNAVKVYATYTPYWGNSSHPNIGYSSQDPVQVTKEVTDMTRRGLDGAIIDWYGPGSWEDGAAVLFKQEVERRPPFTFALMIDQGAVKWHSCYPGCGATTALLNLIADARNEGFFSSPAAIRYDSKTVVEQFGLEAYAIDWSQVTRANPDLMWVFENASGFHSQYTGGAYAWVNGRFDGQDEGLNYLRDFYWNAGQNDSDINVGGIWKGFDDSAASWGSHRRINQKCGATLLDTFAAANSYAGRLDAVQLATWNDYEEGSELQTGVDNCVSVLKPAVNGKLLSWVMTGKPVMVDHFNVFISTDGQNLTLLDTVPSSVLTLDLSQFQIKPGSYSVYVQAYGKPMMKNAMSAPVTYTAIGKTTIDLSAQPMVAIQVNATTKSDYNVTAVAVYLDNVLVYSAQGSQAQVTVPTTSGVHDVAVNAWDSNNGVTVQHQRVVVP